MSTFLRNNYVFGPVDSRRLGNSLGINVLPLQKKVCNFNCVYCECGWNNDDVNLELASTNKPQIYQSFPPTDSIKTELYETLSELKSKAFPLDVITFSGNGEPTLHPNFEQIINDTIEVRNAVMPEVKISVLSNATNLSNPNVFAALTKVDSPILKLDSANQTTLEHINLHNIKNSFDGTKNRINVEMIVDGMKQFRGNFILQIMFLRGVVSGVFIDNTTVAELQGLLDIINKVKPRQIMIYPIDRQTPARQLIKISTSELQKIATKIHGDGYDVLYV